MTLRYPRGASWWYLSFAGEDRWLGACIVEGSDIATAAAQAHAKGCNPGGEVQGIPLLYGPKPAHCNRLLTIEEAEGVEF